MTMTPQLYSGFGGAVDGVPGVGQWEISAATTVRPFAHSGTRGGTGRVVGNDDWKGSYQAYGAVPAKMPWDTGTFTGTIDGTKGASGPALFTRAAIQINVEAATPLEHTVQFEGNGEVTLGAAAASDTAITIPAPARGLKASLGTLDAAPTWTDLAIRAAALSVAAPGQAGVDSSTAGAVLRVKGNLDCTAMLKVYIADPGQLPAKGSHAALRLYVDPANYWEILWMIVQDVSEVRVDLKTKALVGATISLGWNALELIGGTATLGHIARPGDTTPWWPPTS
jgi:hypothetical protein